MHQLKRTVDLGKRQSVGNHRVDLDLALHVPVHDFWDIGASTGAAEGCASPDPAGDQLERSGRNLLSGTRDPDDDAFAPSAVTALERLAHDRDIAGAIERVI